MNTNIFKNLIETSHLNWLSNILKIDYTSRNGIDLVDDYIGIELKSRYLFYGYRLAIHSYQVNQFREDNHGKSLFWCILFYDLSKKPNNIKKEEVSSSITRRDAYFLEWDWVRKFPISDKAKTGPYIYVGMKDFPERSTFKHLTLEKGSVYAPRNSILEDILS